MNLLNELMIYFTERALRGEGSCRFSVPPGSLSALLDVHTYIFCLPMHKKQVCLRVCFDVGKETLRRRYEFTVSDSDFYTSEFLQQVQETADYFVDGIDFTCEEIEAFGDETPFSRAARAWAIAIEGLSLKTYIGGFKKRPPMFQLRGGWERVMGY